jgi:hypothetical protein
MPFRVSKNPEMLLALSPNAVATALGIRNEQVQAFVNSGALPVYRCGTKSKILIADVETLVRSWPQTTKRRKRKVPSNG